MSRPATDITGRIYGRLFVVGRAPGRGRDGSTLWLCKCTCGAEVTVIRCNLPRTRSCGCYKREVARSLMSERQMSVRGLLDRVTRLERVVEEQRLQLDALKELVEMQGRRAA
ncbi:MAG: hypothetical protein AB7E70_19545 [Hyphomicrobiaceae bacterium]